MSHRRSRPRLIVGLVAIAALAAVPVALAQGTSAPTSRADLAQTAKAGHSHPAKGAHERLTKVALALPRPGDFSYAVAQVRIDGRARPPRGGRGRVFASSVGGLGIAASTPGWHRLRATTHAYVVVSRVANAPDDVRNVFFFVTRRRAGHARGTRGAVTFKIANGAPQVGSFWVHGVDRRGDAIVFNDPSAITTALDNWSRYLGVLKIARALLAAAHPRDLTGEFHQPRGGAGPARAKDGVRGGGQGLWTGGERLNRDTRRVFELIFGTIGDPAAFRAAKESPLVPAFIAKDLNNPALAKRWRQVMAVLPLEIPDTYAANAKEEAKFSTVHAPRITSATVAIADHGNAGSQAAIDSPASGTDPRNVGQRVDVHVLGPSGGTISLYLRQSTANGLQPDPSTKVDCSTGCSFFYPAGEHLELDAGDGSAAPFEGWQGCTGGVAGIGIATRCYVDVGFGSTINVYARFGAAFGGKTAALDISLPGAGEGTVTSAPAGIDCPGTCSADFPLGQAVTLTATPASGWTLAALSGCDAGSVSGNTCTVTMSADKTVSATFAVLPKHTLTVSKAGSGSGTVTSSPGGINCGATCSASYDAGQSVTLTATPASGSTFDGWSGCDTVSGQTCTVAMSSDRSPQVSFGTASAGNPGQLDPTFGTGGIALTPVGSGGDGADAIVRQSDGKLVVVGTGIDSHSNLVVEVARYTSTGALDTTFGGSGIVTLPQNSAGDVLFGPRLALQPSSGEIIVAGTWESPTNLYAPGDFGAVALKTDGTLDTSFGSSGLVDTSVGAASSDTAGAVALDPTSGEIYIGGSALPAAGGTDTQMALAAYSANGALDSHWGAAGSLLTPIAGGNAAIQALALDGSSIVAAGSFFNTTSGNPSTAVMRYTSTGTPDSTFNGGAPATFDVGTDSYAHAVLVQSSHKIVVGGVGGFGPLFCMALGRLNADGSQDSSFGSSGTAHLCPGTASGDDSEAYALASDGTYIYAAGNSFINSTGVNHLALARFSTDGALDPSFGGSGYVIGDPIGSGNSSVANGVVLDGSNPVVAGQAYDTTSKTTDFALERFLG